MPMGGQGGGAGAVALAILCGALAATPRAAASGYGDRRRGDDSFIIGAAGQDPRPLTPSLLIRRAARRIKGRVRLCPAAGAAAESAAKPGCSAPVGAKWDRWDMAGSTYNYCYKGCHMPWLVANKARYNLSAYAGVVGVDHYWTGQGVPCGADGLPREFDMQDALASRWKAEFPGGMRYLSYRIPSAVGYDRVVQKKLASDPDFFVRWKAEPDAATKLAQRCPADGAGCHKGDVCVNHYSPCFNSPQRINDPKHACSVKVSASAYNFLRPGVADWFLQNVLYRTLEKADGMWMDGPGWDNGGWPCSGVSPRSQGKFDASNTPLNQSEIDQMALAQAAVVTRGRQHILAHGGFDMNCFSEESRTLPSASDSAQECGSKVLSMAARAANHSWYNMVIAYGGIEGATRPLGYSDSTAAASVAAFLLVRGQHWLFAIGEQSPCNPNAYPGAEGYRPGSPQCNASSTNTMAPATAALLVTDYGRPLGAAHAVPGEAHVYAREYERATVSLDCGTFRGAFSER